MKLLPVLYLLRFIIIIIKIEIFTLSNEIFSGHCRFEPHKVFRVNTEINSGQSIEFSQV